MNQDILTKIGYELDIPTLAAYCRSGKNMNRATCDNPNFWRDRLRQDFHYVNQTDNPKDAYYQLYDYMQTYADFIFDSYPRYIKQKLDKSTFTADVINTITTEVVQPFYDRTINMPAVISLLIRSMSIYTEYSDGILDQMGMSEYESFDIILDNAGRADDEKNGSIKWSNELFRELIKQPDSYLDVKRGRVVNINDMKVDQNNLIRLPSLRVVGTRENIIIHFRALGTLMSDLEQHLNTGIPLDRNAWNPFLDPDSPR